MLQQDRHPQPEPARREGGIAPSLPPAPRYFWDNLSAHQAAHLKSLKVSFPLGSKDMSIKGINIKFQRLTKAGVGAAGTTGKF